MNIAKEKEPAATGTVTSSKEKHSQEYNTANSAVCQEAFVKNLFATAQRAVKTILDTYNNMTEAEQRAFDMGEAFRDMLTVQNELEELSMKGGEAE